MHRVLMPRTPFGTELEIKGETATITVAGK